MDINATAKEIQHLKKATGESFRQVNLKKLKKELLEVLMLWATRIDDYVLYKTDTLKPYLQIYTLKSWEISQEYFNKTKNEIYQ